MIPRRDAEALLDEFVLLIMADPAESFETLRDRLTEKSDLVGRGAENVAQKARRLLAEGRLEVVRADKGGIVVARCRGDSAEVYDLGFDPGPGEWRCTCPARSKCSHIAALQLVTVRKAKKGGPG